jgi:hypothetical protein
MGDPRAHPASPGRPGPVLTTSHDDDQVQVDPSLAQHGLRQLRAPGSNLGQTTRRHEHGGRPRRPRPSQAVRLPAPATPRNLTPRRTPRRTDTGRRTLDTWTLRRPHRTPVTWTGPRRTPDARTGHWTPDAGHERGHGDDTTAGIRTSLAAMPSDRTLRRAPVLCPRTTRQPLGRLAGQAAPRRTAVLGRLRVERRAAWWPSSGIRRGENSVRARVSTAW